MNVVEAFLARRGDVGPRTYLLLTPRFQASRHVVFLALGPGDTWPSLVAKLPRRAHDTAAVAREAHNLERIAELLPRAAPGIPRLTALDLSGAWPIQVQTGLTGRALDRATVRRDPERWCHLAAAWLAALTVPGSTVDGAEALAQALMDLDQLAEPAADDPELERLLGRTRPLLAPLGHAPLPRVVEHGDFSAPNVMVLADGSLGAVDWELAAPDGLPLRDLAFFLTYVAFARGTASSVADQVATFDAAFFGSHAWAWARLRAQAQVLNVPESAVAPLFLSTWARYVAGLWNRLAGTQDKAAVLAWLRNNRYHALWRHTVAHLEAQVEMC